MVLSDFVAAIRGKLARMLQNHFASKVVNRLDVTLVLSNSTRLFISDEESRAIVVNW